MNHTHTSCSSANPPTYYDEDCKDLAAQQEIGDSEIVDENGNLITKCYTQSAGDAGWYVTVVLHYGQFWKILSQNWSMNFCSCGFIFILFLNILAPKAQKTVNHVLSFSTSQIETKLNL